MPGFTGCTCPNSAGCAPVTRGVSAPSAESCASSSRTSCTAHGTELFAASGAVFSGFPNIVAIQGNMAELARLNRARLGNYYLAGGPAGKFHPAPHAGRVLQFGLHRETGPGPRPADLADGCIPAPGILLDPAPDPGPRPCRLLNVGCHLSAETPDGIAGRGGDVAPAGIAV